MIELRENISHKSILCTAIFMQRTMYLSVCKHKIYIKHNT